MLTFEVWMLCLSVLQKATFVLFLKSYVGLVFFCFKEKIVNIFLEAINYSVWIQECLPVRRSHSLHFHFGGYMTWFIYVVFSHPCWVFPPKMALHRQHWLRMRNVVRLPFSQHLCVFKLWKVSQQYSHSVSAEFYLLIFLSWIDYNSNLVICFFLFLFWFCFFI